jgi:hypothetical protein
MDISGGIDAENRDIHMVKQNGKKHQQWDLIYVKDWKGEPKDGEWNHRFGFKVNRPFYVISRLGSGRYLDYISRDLLIKTQNGRTSQQWYFHQASRTVRGKATNQSWDIKSSGKSDQLQYYSTSSKWW